MVTIIVLILYFIVWYKLSLYQAHIMNENYEKDHPVLSLDRGDKALHLTGSMFVNLVWPIWIPLYCLFNYMLGKVPPTTKELHKQLKERDHRILELEKELKIK